MDKQISPLPWVCDGLDIRVTTEGELLGHAYAMDDGEYDAARANAAFIVKAVNSHDMLVRALRAAHDAIENEYGRPCTHLDAIDAVLAAVEAA